jgi:hypothetical protein
MNIGITPLALLAITVTLGLAFVVAYRVGWPFVPIALAAFAGLLALVLFQVWRSSVRIAKLKREGRWPPDAGGAAT